jgi:hypothetical protein
MAFLQWADRGRCIQLDMKSAKRTMGGWGLVLTVVAGYWVGCSPRVEIGEAEPDGAAGAPDNGNMGGSAGSSAAGTGVAGSGSGGKAGSSGLGPADGDGCFDRMTAAGSPLPKLGPNNRVFPVGRQDTSTLLNYAEQVVFDPPNWELNANFPPSASSDDTEIQLPDELSEVPENLGEIHITRPQCKGLLAAGRTVRVHVWWKLGGAIVRTPTEGIALGTTDGASFADSTQANLVGDDQYTMPLNTLNPLVLEHTFPASDTTDAGDLVLKLWLLESFAFPSTLYINRVEWE